jgi:hypothetical protein
VREGWGPSSLWVASGCVDSSDVRLLLSVAMDRNSVRSAFKLRHEYVNIRIERITKGVPNASHFTDGFFGIGLAESDMSRVKPRSHILQFMSLPTMTLRAARFCQENSAT